MTRIVEMSNIFYSANLEKKTLARFIYGSEVNFFFEFNVDAT